MSGPHVVMTEYKCFCGEVVSPARIEQHLKECLIVAVSHAVEGT
jgi:hypothetical protein